MPRPGPRPRPYDCVRRAWHSERHQPIRGTLIREIFRLVHEVHSPTTRTNKEWLEKLPLVVLKAEEILYSKANSEGEYMDLKTLWDRINDAIDTIIRKDDASETRADLLQPCIEAALNLGCIPRRASRSQRHDNPGSYLSSINKEPIYLDSSLFLRLLPLPPPSTSQHNSLSQLQAWYAALVASCSIGPDISIETKDIALFSNPDFAAPPVDCPGLSYCCDVQPRVRPEQSAPFDCEDGMVLLHNSIGSDNTNTSPKPLDNECDLSLRLGLFSTAPLDRESNYSHEAEDVGSSSSCVGSKYSEPSPSGTRAVNLESSFTSFSRGKCFGFFSLDSTQEPFESCSSKWSSEEEEMSRTKPCDKSKEG